MHDFVIGKKVSILSTVNGLSHFFIKVRSISSYDGESCSDVRGRCVRRMNLVTVNIRNRFDKFDDFTILQQGTKRFIALMKIKDV